MALALVANWLVPPSPKESLTVSKPVIRIKSIQQLPERVDFDEPSDDGEESENIPETFKPNQHRYYSVCAGIGKGEKLRKGEGEELPSKQPSLTSGFTSSLTRDRPAWN